jgi:hypothetical protein
MALRSKSSLGFVIGTSNMHILSQAYFCATCCLFDRYCDSVSGDRVILGASSPKQSTSRLIDVIIVRSRQILIGESLGLVHSTAR